MKSKLNPRVFYTGNVSFDIHDLNRPLTKYEQYEIQAPDSKKKYILDILIGNKNVKEKDDLVYFYIYTATSQQRLGLFEFPLDQLPRSIDADGDLIPPSKPLLFPFVDTSFLEGVWQIQQKKLKQPLIRVKQEKEKDKEKGKEETFQDLVISNNKTSNNNKQPPLYSYIHPVVDRSVLPTETETEAKRVIQEYKSLNKSCTMHWLNERMKNMHYTVPRVESFLTILEKVLVDLGKKTTQQGCQHFIAHHPEAEVHFQEDQTLYSELETLRFELETRLDCIASRMADIASWLKKSQQQQLPSTIEALKQEQLQLQMDQKQTQIDMEWTRQDIRTLVPHMRNITTLEQYRQYIESPQFQLPVWAIQILQEEFQIICLFFRQHLSPVYPEKISMLPLDKKARPDVYLLLTLEHSPPETAPTDPPTFKIDEWTQVGLVQYKNHRVFQFSELPYSVKCLATQNIESTPFRFLPDFTSFTGCHIPLTREKSRFPFPVFLLDSKTVPKIPQKKWILFRSLLRNPEWYKMLADDYPIQLTLDGHQWTSVTHYVEAGRFPDNSVYYLEFTKVEASPSLISKSAELAKLAAQQPGVYRQKKTTKGVELSNVEYIPKPHILRVKDPNLQERRRKVLREKFRHPVFKSLLLATLEVMLLDERGNEDKLLMQVRQMERSMLKNINSI